MFCPSCGSENPGNAQFCGGCGQRIAITPDRQGTQSPVTPVALQAPVAAAPPPVVNAPPATPQVPQAVVNTPPAAPAAAQSAPAAVPAPPNVPTYLVLAIIATLCCGCPPVGIISLIFALQVSGKLKAGDIAGAQRASSRAKMWGIVGIIFGLIVNGIALFVYIAEQENW